MTSQDFTLIANTLRRLRLHMPNAAWRRTCDAFTIDLEQACPNFNPSKFIEYINKERLNTTPES